ncbi:MAG TPA: DNA replication and repair protein RecF [Nitrolancea sp.]|jgi:DNA replication and repair protein RecF|nr:DNA replication and repair protein RecF [Nitrolancea sp.]
MKLLRLELEEFRNYRRAVLDVPAAGLRVYGANATGKTSLLESIYLLATTRSPRASVDRDLINWESNEEFELAPYARASGHIAEVGATEREVEIALLADANRPTVARKRAKIDGRTCRVIDLVGTLKVVLFSPEDLNLVLGSPSGRRRYLDISISQFDRTYLRALTRYNKLVERRNSLLKDLGNRAAGRVAEDELAYWDEEFTAYASYILAARIRYLVGLDRDATEAFARLARSTERLRLEYIGTVELPESQLERVVNGSIDDAQPLIARAVGILLRRRRHEELRRGSTLIGPHRDDFTYFLNDRNLAAFGSRGQQRLAVVATKLAELAQIVAATGESPVLLLDDVLSELDPEHQNGLLGALGGAGCQTIVTATSRELLEHSGLEHLPMISIERGSLTFVDP